MSWTADKMPQLPGKTVVVTGSNSGIGLAAAEEFARAGAHVVFACRTESKARNAMQQVTGANAEASVEFIPLDLSSLESVKSFADAFRARHEQLHLLVNNAGVMIPPFSQTADGFELQFGTNHLGHFALTGHLIDMLSATPGARVVNVASMAHKMGKMNFDDLNWQQRKYDAWGAYGQSKLANLLFTLELQDRLAKSNADVITTAAHPGWTLTDLQRHSGVVELGSKFFAQPAKHGAWPTLAAAVADANGGEYWGPKGLFEMTGPAKLVSGNKRAQNKGDAERLWQESEKLTGVPFELN